MINVGAKLLQAWYLCIAGNVPVPTYTEDAAPDNENSGNYVLLRMESETNQSNNQAFVTSPVIITEVVTRFSVRIDYEPANQIDSLIGQAVNPTPAQHGLPAQTGIQIVEIRRENSTTLTEDDGTYKYYRIITRNLHRIVQN